MKGEEAQTTAIVAKKGGPEASLLGKGGYKFWALAAILMLAFWSMFTGSVTLQWSAGNVSRFHDDVETHIPDDLDVLELEEREKVVRRMWDVYTHSSSIQLPRFWLEAFEAAYEHLTSDAAAVKDTAVSEIAKMSLQFVDVDSTPLQSTSTLAMQKKSSKQAAEEAKEETSDGLSR